MGAPKTHCTNNTAKASDPGTMRLSNKQRNAKNTVEEATGREKETVEMLRSYRQIERPPPHLKIVRGSACLPFLGLVGLLVVQEQVGGLDSCEAFPGLRRWRRVVSAFQHAARRIS